MSKLFILGRISEETRGPLADRHNEDGKTNIDGGVKLYKTGEHVDTGKFE